MWSRIFSSLLVALFLCLWCLPAAAHNGYDPVGNFETGDEHPWGGDNHNGPTYPQDMSIDPDFDTPQLIYIRLALERMWYNLFGDSDFAPRLIIIRPDKTTDNSKNQVETTEQILSLPNTNQGARNK